jgi:hypothetical protein
VSKIDIEFKVCTKCKERKPRSAFGLNTNDRGHTYLRSWCNPCCSKYRSEKQKLWTAHQKEKHREYVTKTRYGVTSHFISFVKQAQRNACAICRVSFGLDQKTKPFIDHNHSTGEVRGLLCQACNSLLGMAKDSGTVLLSAYRYLLADGSPD